MRKRIWIACGALLVAGGTNFPEKMPWEGGKKVWYDDVYVLDRSGGRQLTAGVFTRFGGRDTIRPAVLPLVLLNLVHHLVEGRDDALARLGRVHPVLHLGHGLPGEHAASLRAVLDGSGRAVANSLLLATITTLVQLVTSATAAYALRTWSGVTAMTF